MASSYYTRAPGPLPHRHGAGAGWASGEAPLLRYPPAAPPAPPAPPPLPPRPPPPLPPPPPQPLSPYELYGEAEVATGDDQGEMSIFPAVAGGVIALGAVVLGILFYLKKKKGKDDVDFKTYRQMEKGVQRDLDRAEEVAASPTGPVKKEAKEARGGKEDKEGKDPRTPTKTEPAGVGRTVTSDVPSRTASGPTSASTSSSRPATGSPTGAGAKGAASSPPRAPRTGSPAGGRSQQSPALQRPGAADGSKSGAAPPKPGSLRIPPPKRPVPAKPAGKGRQPLLPPPSNTAAEDEEEDEMGGGDDGADV